MADDAVKTSGPKGLDMDQAALDAAYDQAVWAPNQKCIHARRDVAATDAHARLKPSRHSYGATPIEAFDFFRGPEGAGIAIYVHGGAWRSGTAANFSHLAETFLSFGLNAAVLDLTNIDDAGGNLLTMATQCAAPSRGSTRMRRCWGSMGTGYSWSGIPQGAISAAAFW